MTCTDRWPTCCDVRPDNGLKRKNCARRWRVLIVCDGLFPTPVQNFTKKTPGGESPRSVGDKSGLTSTSRIQGGGGKQVVGRRVKQGRADAQGKLPAAQTGRVQGRGRESKAEVAERSWFEEAELEVLALSSPEVAVPTSTVIPAAPTAVETSDTAVDAGTQRRQARALAAEKRNRPAEDERDIFYQGVLTNSDVASDPIDHVSGYVAIIGRPNAGKSTLLNALVGQKLSIVSHRVQTTRHRVLGILSGPDHQV